MPVEVKPGLTCDDAVAEFVTCTNTTSTDYVVIQTRQCKGGTISTGYGSSYQSVTYEPSVKTASIFVPANNTGFADNGCPYEPDYASSDVTYQVERP